MEPRNATSRDVVPADKPSKMSRLIARDTVRGSAEDFDRALSALDAEVRNAWEQKWGHYRNAIR